jgi:recombination protein RecA
MAIMVGIEIQKSGKAVFFQDYENAFDPEYAKKLGLNIDDPNLFLFSQPETAEEGLEVLEQVIRSGKIGLAIVDSVAAMTTKKEIDGDYGDSNMGTHAKLMSQACRKLVGPLNESGAMIIFLNQTRSKIGVVYGCLQGETLVCLEDGTSRTIRDIVKNKVNAKVWSFNEKTQKYVLSPIIGWHENGKVDKKEDFIHFLTEATESKNGFFGFTVTPNHKILTQNGWKEAKEVKNSDMLLSKYNSNLNGSFREFILGTSNGDCGFGIRSKNTASMTFQDNSNKEYENWKKEKLKKVIDVYDRPKGFRTAYTYELSKFKKEIVKDRCPLHLLNNEFSYLSLALWIMDDAHLDLKSYHERYRISMGRFSKQDYRVKLIQEAFLKNGLVCSIGKRATLTFTRESSKQISTNIRKFVPECMQYKLFPEDRGFYEEFDLECKKTVSITYVKIIEKRYASGRQLRDKNKYDITVEGHHNYLVGGQKNGIIVHNSPITTPGGAALGFYSSIRIQTSKGELIKEGDKVVGNKVKIKVIKNKVAAPFGTCEFPLYYGLGVDKTGDFFDFMVDCGIIKQGGAWFSFGSDKLGQGRDNSIDKLANDPVLYSKIKAAYEESKESKEV